ncbi:MAG: NAD(P)-dependent oxidoreductase [Chloroflexi bacterium HGW-Chloroflexi-4]|nr:MAG: NAD(P)-dependent oxidoreductase [Chloroflexi bacterium HGW-Chloroflexi-4]
MIKKRIVITGGSGFIGTNLIDQLLVENTELINIDINPPKKQNHFAFWKECDIRNFETLDNLLKEFQPEIIVHLAAKTDLNGKTLSDYAANTDGVENLINSSMNCKDLKLVIFASTRLVNKIGYQPKTDEDYSPTTLYGESKMLGEKTVRALSKNMHYQWIILRPTSIWGPWFGTPYNDFFMSIIHSLYIHPKGYKIKKSFGYVGNTVFELTKLIDDFPAELNQKTSYLCDFEPIDVFAWAQSIALLQHVRPPLEVKICFLKIIAKCGDFLKKLGYKEPPLTSFRLNNIVTNMIYDTNDLEAFCGPLPFSQQDGIRATLDWINRNK